VQKRFAAVMRWIRVLLWTFNFEPFFSIKVRWHDSMTFAERKKIDLLPEHRFVYNFALLMVFLFTFLNFMLSFSIPILIQYFSVLQSGISFEIDAKRRIILI
jgi:hypothetical protein